MLKFGKLTVITALFTLSQASLAAPIEKTKKASPKRLLPAVQAKNVPAKSVAAKSTALKRRSNLKPTTVPAPKPISTLLAPAPAPAPKTVNAPGVVSLPMKKVEPAKPKKPAFGIMYRSYNKLDVAAIRQEEGADGEVKAWDRLNLTYNITDNFSVSAMPQWEHTWFGDRDRPQDKDVPAFGQSGSGFLLNTALILTHSKLAVLKGDMILGGFLRYDIPTSEVASKSGSLGELWTELDITKSFGKFEIQPQVILRYYLQQYQTSTAYKEATLEEDITQPDGNIVPRGTRVQVPLQNTEYKIYTLLAMSYKITPKLTAAFETGFINVATHADGNIDPSTGKARDAGMKNLVEMNPQVEYGFNDSFSLALGWYEEPDMKSLKTDYIPFNAANGGEVYMMATVKF